MNDYKRNREFYEDVSGSLTVLAATDDTTLVTARDQYHAIYVQRLHVRVTTLSASKTWSFEDTASTPLSISGALPTDAAPATFDLDFGARGMPLAIGKNFRLNVSAVGAAGVVTWEGYQRPEATMFAS